MAASEFTKRCRRKLWLFRILDWLCLITPILIYVVIALSNDGIKVGYKITLMSMLIIAIILLAYGVNTLILDLNNDINVVKTDATIVSYGENEYGYKRPIVEYSVDNKTYTAMIEVFTAEIQNSDLNDTVEIHYNKKNPSELAYSSYYENIYIPCFLISLCLFVVVIIKSKK